MKLDKNNIGWAGEANLNLAEETRFLGMFGIKLSIGDQYQICHRITSRLKFSSALSYSPNKCIKFTWSDRINIGKTLRRPETGFDYRYGFSISVDFDCI